MFGDYPKACVNNQTGVRLDYSVWMFYLCSCHLRGQEKMGGRNFNEGLSYERNAKAGGHPGSRPSGACESCRAVCPGT